MAITADYPGIRIEVRVEGVALQEYDDDEEQPSGTTITKYIEATSGVTFDMRFGITPKWPGSSIMFYTHLDGRYVRGHFAQQQSYRGSSSVQIIEASTYTKDGQWFKARFAFSALNIGISTKHRPTARSDPIADDSDIRNVGDQLMRDMKEMGEIKVKVFFVKNVRDSSTNALSETRTLDVSNIPEKALKGRALSHQATLCAPEASPQSSILSFDHLDTNCQPFITFKFKYRSRAALQSLLIIPREPSPAPLEDRDFDTLTLEEARELIRRQREREDAAPNIKREGTKRERSSTAVSEDQDNDDVSFVSAKRRRIPVTLNENGIEIIDLT
ncbi:hypothetical protein G6011_08667 [Alternaria panax]|uniref:DUF7918 domain-containing protein n=1 Tax=Alternaria panax TaxID=48097 RepID=A0AAD4FMV8_9PLEO|nr:hypothetical protein G6011_08667 [Alternaria panax]